MKTLTVAMLTLGCALMTGACASSPADDGSVSVVDPPPDDAKEDASNGLTTAQQKTALTLLDDACGDAWCETDFGWAFKKLVCHFDVRTCTITVAVTRPAASGIPAGTYTRACKMTAIKSFKQLVDTAANGYQSLTDSFFTKFDNCATKIEATIPAS